MNKSILIIGKPHSSKSVFIAQLYSKIRQNRSKLKLYKPVEDLSSISSTRKHLANGEEPETTPANEKVQLILPLVLDNKKFDLICPDYGGEQINHIILTRDVDKSWVDSIKASNDWILFIRLNNIAKSLDISNITVTEEHTKNTSTESNYSISDQSAFIELVQIFLHIKENNIHFKNSSVKLTVALTCWDELNTKELPKEILKNNLPLFFNFLEANWLKEKLNIVGLSAQGFSLNIPENKTKYQIEGPENFSYLVNSQGKRIDDITELISEAIS